MDLILTPENIHQIHLYEMSKIREDGGVIVLDSGSTFRDSNGVLHTESCAFLSIYSAILLEREKGTVGSHAMSITSICNPETLKQFCNFRYIDQRPSTEYFHTIANAIYGRIIVRSPGAEPEMFGSWKSPQITINLYLAFSHYTVDLTNIHYDVGEFAAKHNFTVYNLLDQCENGDNSFSTIDNFLSNNNIPNPEEDSDLQTALMISHEMSDDSDIVMSENDQLQIALAISGELDAQNESIPDDTEYSFEIQLQMIKEQEQIENDRMMAFSLDNNNQ